jgi:hypothetical protein
MVGEVFYKKCLSSMANALNEVKTRVIIVVVLNRGCFEVVLMKNTPRTLEIKVKLELLLT